VKKPSSKRLKLNPLALWRDDLSIYGWTIVNAHPGLGGLVRFQFGLWGYKIVNIFFLPAARAYFPKIFGGEAVGNSC